MLSPVSLGLQKFYPSLQPGVGYTGSANYVWLHPYTTGGAFSDYYSGNWLFLRLDHNLTSKNSLFFSGQLRNTPYDWPGNVPALPQTHVRNEGLITLSDIHTFSPRLVNHFVASVSHDSQIFGTPSRGSLPHGESLIQQIGLQGVDPSGYNGVGMPGIAFCGQEAPAGLGQPGISCNYNVSGALGWVQDNATDWSLADDVTWSKGRHVLSFGETFQHIANGKDAFSGGTPDYGNFQFDGRYTTGWQNNPSICPTTSGWCPIPNSGFSYADFLLGLTESSERSSPLLDRTLNTKVFGIYAADTFKVTPRLTLDYGLRWDYEGLANYADGLMYNFNPALNEIIVPAAHLNQVQPDYLSGLACPTGAASTCAPPTIVTGNERPTPDWGNWGPRFGVAYRLPGEVVLRGGYGLYWQRYSRFYNGTQIGYGDGPFWPLAQNYYAPTFMPAQVPGSLPPPLQFPYPFATSTYVGPSPASEGLTSLGAHWHNGSINNFNVTLEKEWRKNGFRASYIGSRSENQIWFANFDQKPANMTPYVNANGVPLVPFPNLSYVWEARNGGKAHYDAFQFEAKRRQGSVTFDASYTLASDINNMGNVDGNNVYNYLSRWAANGGDTRNRVVLTTSWNLPFGKGRRFLAGAPGVVNQVVGGWTLESFTYLASGWLFGPYFNGNIDYPNTNTYSGLPDMIPGTNGNLPRGQRSYSRFFNTPVVSCSDPNGCGLGSVDNTPYVYSQLGAFMIPGCPLTDPLCLNTAQVAVGRYGNAGVTSLHGDPLAVTHLGIGKTFPIREHMALRYSLLISDLFNHPHYYNPDGTITDLFNNGNGGPCVGILNNYNCDSSEGVFEGNHAGFRTMAMKVQFDF